LPEKTADLWWLFTRQTITVTQNETVLNASLLMQRRNFRHLPVTSEAGKITGILSAQDVIDSMSLVLSPESAFGKVLDSLEIPVFRIMAIHPIVVEKGDGLSEVVKKLYTNNIGAVPVVDEKGIVQGIITLRDLVSLLGTGSEPMDVRVSELMTKKIVTIDSKSTILDAVTLMSNMRVRRLPIVSSNGELMGMLTNKDILRYLANPARSREAIFNAPLSEMMTREVIRVDPDDDVRVAASRMMIFGIGGLLMEGPSPLSGLVTERDLVKKLVDVRSVNFVVQAMRFELEAEKAYAN
jgi:CBS domain-containing protein